VIIVDRPVGFFDADDALLLAQCVDLSIRVHEGSMGIKVPANDRLRVLLAQLTTVAAFREERVGIPGDGAERKVQTVSVNEAAAVLGIGDRAVRGRCERGTLRSVLVDGRRRIFLDDLQEVSSR
jgi:hypothetical protein